MAANDIDVDQADADGIALVLRKRLKLTDQKLATLSAGLRQIADKPDPLGVVKAKREMSENLELSLITVPIGVLMIIFESRPDSMPQISALALASGNGLLLKGGKEAVNSNAKLHEVIGDAIESGSDGKIKRDIIALVTSRGQVADMLSLDDVIDLVIPVAATRWYPTSRPILASLYWATPTVCVMYTLTAPATMLLLLVVWWWMPRSITHQHAMLWRLSWSIKTPSRKLV